MSWYDSHLMCMKRGQRLVTMGMPSQFRDFQRFVASLPQQSFFIFIGAQLLERREAVPVEAFYKHIWQWTDGRSAFFLNLTISNETAPRCANYDIKTATVTEQTCHAEFGFTHLLCEFDRNTTTTELSPVKGSNSTDTAGSIKFPKLISTLDSNNHSMVSCPQGHMTKSFLSCDARSGCVKEETMDWCETREVTVPMFHCVVGHMALPYSLVCDHIEHCLDHTDEDFCHFEACPDTDYMQCRNGQCVSTYRDCDQNMDCYDGSDEPCKMRFNLELPLDIRLLVVLEMNGKGNYSFLSTNSCPDTHVMCPEGVCFPVYLRCNNIPDCLEKEDEKGCDNFICMNFYRCWGSYMCMCLHPDHVCDSVPHCPQWDDELLCEPYCPTACRCQGLAFICNKTFNANVFPQIRYLDASGSNMELKDFSGNRLLVRLHLSRSNVSTITNMTLPNLQHLDLRHNQMASIDIDVFRSLKNLRVLDLSYNPLSGIINTDPTTSHPMILRIIDLSFTELKVYNGTSFANCKRMETINVSWSKLTTILEEGFKSTPLLQTVDARGSPLTTFPKDVLTNLISLKTVHVDNYKLCCPVMLPSDFNLNYFHSKQDVLASCDDLLKSNTYRICIWVMAAMAIVGNVGSFVAKIYLDGSTLGSFGVFVTNLSVCDFLMGVYLVVIGSADLVYRGRYLFQDVEWKQSFACTIAGCLSFLSSEGSAFFVCCITLDRFLVLRFPFRQAPFSRRSALVTCGVIWAVGFVLIIVPVLPSTSHWQFYSQNGICIPLPFSGSDDFPGYTYSFTVMIVLNFTLLILIAIGQIYLSVRVNSVASKERAARDATIVRRLTLIVLSDFACWCPIGLLGVIASTGFPIPDEVNVAMAIFVIPTNSALNPFLYTLNVLMEKRQKAREDYLLKKLEVRTKTPSVTTSAKPSL